MPSARLLLACFSDRVLCSYLDWPWTVTLLSLTPEWLGLQVCTTMPSPELKLFKWYL
jgi:hypothetical protein